MLSFWKALYVIYLIWDFMFNQIASHSLGLKQTSVNAVQQQKR